MTRISEIHGIREIPADEIRGRAANVRPTGPVPYLSLTAGEMRLWLAAQLAKSKAQYYGADAPQYQRAYTMIENALTRGAHANYAFVGAIPDALQPVAALIRQAKNNTAPASNALPFDGPLVRRVSGIGEVIPAGDRLLACVKAAKGKPAEIAKCYKAFNIETTMNKYINGGSHHMLYKSLTGLNALPTTVAIKANDHKKAVQNLAQIAKLSQPDLMDMWMETEIINRNQTGGVGDLGSVKTSWQLAPNPEDAAIKYGINAIPRAANVAGFILDALLKLLLEAINLCIKWLTDLQKVDFAALVNSQGFATEAFGPEKTDWQNGSGSDNNTLLLLAAAAGAYLLLEK